MLLLGVVPIGCTKPNPALSCEDGLCSDPTVPYCDVDGTLGGEGPNTCIHVSLSANESAECRGDKALTCNAPGDNYDLLTCADGCSADENGCKATEPPTTRSRVRSTSFLGTSFGVDRFCDESDFTPSTDTTLDTAG